MTRKIRTYEGDTVAVEFEPRRCIHASECVRGLPGVFDPDRRPWVDPGETPADRIAEVIERCPTGALQYRRLDGGAPEAPDDRNTATVVPHGPLHLRGRIRLLMPGGGTQEETRVALCRCGHSQSKPFCDDSHAEAGFRDGGVILGGRLVPSDEPPAEPVVEVRCRPDGPLFITGPLRVVDVDGRTVDGVRGSLCRCGGSATKPFCDGSHKTGDWHAEGSPA